MDNNLSSISSCLRDLQQLLQMNTDKLTELNTGYNTLSSKAEKMVDTSHTEMEESHDSSDVTAPPLYNTPVSSQLQW